MRSISRLSIHGSSVVLTGMLLAAACACDPKTTPPPDGDASSNGHGAPATTEPARGSAGAATPPDAADIPANIVVSTNEPFWTARAAGTTLLLTGLDHPERKLAITSSAFKNGVRTIVATDAQGRIVVRISDTKCTDNMSGAEFPFSGELLLKEEAEGVEPIRGCARPASMPPPNPPGESTGADATLPEPFRGHWAPDQAGCSNPDLTIEDILISAQELRFHASIGIPAEVEQVDSQTIRITSNYEGEGPAWTATQTLQVRGGDRLVISAQDQPAMRRVRCK